MGHDLGLGLGVTAFERDRREDVDRTDETVLGGLELLGLFEGGLVGGARVEMGLVEAVQRGVVLLLALG